LILLITVSIGYQKHRRYTYYKNIATRLYTNSKKDRYNFYTGWEDYRIGDIVRSPFGINYQSIKENHQNKFPTSIATMYMSKTNKANDYSIVQACISEKKQELQLAIPTQDTYVIHIRIGDVMEDKEYSVITMLAKPTYYYELFPGPAFLTVYTKPLSYYEEKRKQLEKYPIKNIIIVAGSHIQSDYLKSSEYINCIRLYYQEAGYHVSLRLGSLPDEDIVFMSYASYFTSSGGGFSEMISQLVKQNGGIIINQGLFTKGLSPLRADTPKLALTEI